MALGLSALAAVGAAMVALRRTMAARAAVRPGVAFPAARAGRQGTILAASLVFGGTAAAFAPAVLRVVFWTNAFAFTLLVGAQALGARAGLARAPLAHPAG